MKNNLRDLIKTDREFSKLSGIKGAAYAFSQYLTVDAIMLPQNKQPIMGIKSIYESMNNPDSKDRFTWEPKGGKIARSGELGYTWGIYTLVLTNKKIIKGKYLNIWIKQKGGSWKVEVDMGNMS